jgi:hypothetical protein
VLKQGFRSMGLLAVGASLFRCGNEPATAPGGPSGSGGSGAAGSGVGGGGGAGGSARAKTSNIENLGPLGAPDANGVRLPAGFTSRIVAQSGQPPTGSGQPWHGAPDGGATFPTSDGYIYVSNAELSGGAGGVGALEFVGDGTLVDAYVILTGTSRNCAGGPTPWGTWLSCEEVANGQVWECDPNGASSAVVWPALGSFNHEGVAVDPDGMRLYLTEDEPDGRLYRFTPASYPDLSSGTIEVLRVLSGNEGATEWLPIGDPSGSSQPTRLQQPTSTAFNGGEGIWWHQGVIYFGSKGDNRIWALEIASGNLSILYQPSTSANPILSGVDNVVVSPGGDVLVAEDGGDLEIVAITPGGVILPLIQLVGHDSSEITGPAFDPSLGRLYFSSQRGTSGQSSGGMTFEVSGPFFV